MKTSDVNSRKIMPQKLPLVWRADSSIGEEIKAQQWYRGVKECLRC